MIPEILFIWTTISIIYCIITLYSGHNVNTILEIFMVLPLFIVLILVVIAPLYFITEYKNRDLYGNHNVEFKERGYKYSTDRV